MTGEPLRPPTAAADRASRRRHDAARPEPLPPHALAARAALAEQVARGADMDLLEAALWVAAEEYPALEVSREMRRVDVLGGEAARRVASRKNPFARLDAVREFLFDELRFRGNSEAYDDPRNSYLNDVLDRRLGIPLTLSLLYLEVAARAGLVVRGVALPGHFVARIDEQGRTLFVDPFHGGAVITEEDCRDLVFRTTGRAALFRREILDGATGSQMLSRLLLNLKRIHLAQGSYDQALACVERLLIVQPDDPREIRDRGLLLAHMGRPTAAIADLEAYLSRVPEAPDADSVRGRLAWLLRKLTDVS